MKILLTGATGFIGRHTVPLLLARGHQVTALARSIPPTLPAWWNEVQFIAAPIGNDDIVPPPSPDLLLHLAWPRLDDMASEFHLTEILPAQLRWLKMMIGAGVKRIIGAGTCFEYGKQEGCLSETSPPAPILAYAQAKHQLHLQLTEHIAQMPSPPLLQWVRIFYLYGAGQAQRSLMAQLDAAIDNGDPVFNMSPGDQQRDYLTVNEVARRLAILVEHPEVQGIVNCCRGVPITVRQLVEKRIAERGATLRLNLGYYPYPVYEPMAFWGSAQRLDPLLAEEL